MKSTFMLVVLSLGLIALTGHAQPQNGRDLVPALGAAPAATAGLPVRVVNATTQPVPTSVLSLPNVAVASLPGVNVVSMPQVQLAGTPTVSVGNFPAALAVTTAKLVDTTLTAGTSNNTESDIDVSAYRTVRLNVRALPACAGGTTRITVSEAGAGANLAQFDQFDMTPATPANVVYQAPGTSIDVRLDGPANCEAWVKLWGRSN